MHLLDAVITARREVAGGMFVIAMRAPEIAAGVRAGQFVNLGWTRGPLLRRPFSVYRVDGETIEVVLKDVGAGTRELLAMSPGDRLSCLGPLGHGFDFETSSRTAVLISGGLGVAIVYDAAPGGFFFGSGFDLWPRERRGLRIEVRDQLFEEYGTTHLVTVRAAWLFR